MKNSRGHTVKLNGRYQLVIPRFARKTLGLSAGDELLLLVKEDRMVLMRKPKNFTERTAGLHKEIWQGAPDFLENERDSW